MWPSIPRPASRGSSTVRSTWSAARPPTTPSTNEAAIKALNAKEGLNIAILVVPGNTQAFEAVDTGKADAWAGDDAVLYATAAESRNPGDFSVLDEYLSYDPYGIMYRKDDPTLDALVKRTFERL